MDHERADPFFQVRNFFVLACTEHNNPSGAVGGMQGPRDPFKHEPDALEYTKRIKMRPAMITFFSGRSNVLF